MEALKSALSWLGLEVNTWAAIRVCVALFVGGFLGLYIRFLYKTCARSPASQEIVANVLPLLTLITVVVIAVVKSSLALSLGLVGALSIVRFRAAIKEPEELAYLFLNIAIGLGLGADQRVVTVVAFVVIVALLALLRLGRRGAPSHNLYMTVDSTNPEKISLDRIVDIMRRHFSGVDLKRFDETSDALEASFRVEFEDFGRLEEVKRELLSAHRNLKITFLDVQGVNP